MKNVFLVGDRIPQTHLRKPEPAVHIEEVELPVILPAFERDYSPEPNHSEPEQVELPPDVIREKQKEAQDILARELTELEQELDEISERFEKETEEKNKA